MGASDIFTWMGKDKAPKVDIREEKIEDLTDDEKEDVYRRVVLSRWRQSATPTMEEIEHLRQVLPQVLHREHFALIEPEQIIELHEALSSGSSVSAAIRHNSLSLGWPHNDVVMSVVWMACGEGDALARFWMVDALARIVLESGGPDGPKALSVLRDHLEVIGLGRISFEEDSVRTLVRDMAIGPVPLDAKRQSPDHDKIVSAYVDGLVAMRMGPGWRESHNRALRRLGVAASVNRLPPTPVDVDPDEDFGVSFTEDYTPPPPPEPKEAARDERVPRTIQVMKGSASFGEKHLKRYAALERDMPLLECEGVATLGVDLKAEFPWLAGPVDHIARTQALRARGSAPWFNFSPVLIVGPKGIGKTRFARRLAERTRIPVSRINASGRAGAIELLGHSPAYREAHASAPVAALAEHAVANPILFVDELDKFGSSDYNGDPRHALIPMLEPETSRAFPDDFLRTDVDISQVNFIFTANRLDGLPAELLDRMDVFEVGMPGPEHFDGIVAAAIREIAEEHGLAASEMPPMQEAVVEKMRKSFASGTSIRRVKRALKSAVMSSAGYAPH